MVEIRIDTKRDSHEEIRQTIAYLQSIVGDTPTSYDSSDDSSASESSDVFSMFSENTEPITQKTTQDIPTDMFSQESPETVTEEEEAHIEIVDF